MNSYVTIDSLLYQQAKHYPEKTAIHYQNHGYTYRQFVQMVEQVYAWLEDAGCREGEIICINTGRNVYQIAAMFAVLKMRCGFFLLDESLPELRRQSYLRIVQPDYLLNGSSVEQIANTGQRRCPPDTSYIIFTSGSTGQPKGVCTSMHSLAMTVRNFPRSVPLSPNDVILAATSVSFDTYLVETLVALCRGLTVVLADSSEYGNPRLLLKMINRHLITILQLVPSKLKMLLASDPCGMSLAGVEKLLLGGEMVTREWLDEIRNCTPATVYHMYGLTEDSIWSSASCIEKGRPIHIGTSIDGHAIHLLDEDLQEVKQGQTGRIYLSGKGLCKGYLNARMEKIEIGTRTGKTAALDTGDLGEKDDKGRIFLKSRTDDQVKVNGFRVNLCEVEQSALLIPEIQQAVAKVFKADSSQLCICLFYQSVSQMDAQDIQKKLGAWLPYYMIPFFYFRVMQMPYLPSGKIDRNHHGFLSMFEKRFVVGRTEFHIGEG